MGRRVLAALEGVHGEKERLEVENRTPECPLGARRWWIAFLTIWFTTVLTAQWNLGTEAALNHWTLQSK